METIENLISAMVAEVKKNGLELLDSQYAKDLLEFDREVLEKAVPGMMYGWVVGDRHSHLVRLGIEQDEQEVVGCLTNLASNDRFYVINIAQGKFSLQEKSRDEFRALAGMKIPYRAEGNIRQAFWLLKNGHRIGHISTESVGTLNKPLVKVTKTPVSGISDLDDAALDVWCGRAAIKTVGTLFCRWEIQSAAPVRVLAAA